MPGMALFRAAIEMFGMGDTNYIVTDGRFSGYSSGPSIGYLSPEAAEGGTIALVQDGDLIEIDIEARKLELQVSETELRKRQQHVTPPVQQYPKGYLDIYKHLLSSADNGGVLIAPAK